VTCTYPQSIELKTRRRAKGLVRDAILAIAVVVIFVPFALIPLVIR
jgi:hypothetical protein